MQVGCKRGIFKRDGAFHCCVSGSNASMRPDTLSLSSPPITRICPLCTTLAWLHLPACKPVAVLQQPESGSKISIEFNGLALHTINLLVSGLEVARTRVGLDCRRHIHKVHHQSTHKSDRCVRWKANRLRPTLQLKGRNTRSMRAPCVHCRKNEQN